MNQLDAALVRAITAQLETTPDDQRSLRVALLSLIYLVQDEVTPPLREFFDYLLISFPALTSAFEQDRCSSFLGEHPIVRRQVGTHTELLLHEELLWELVDNPSDPRVN